MNARSYKTVFSKRLGTLVAVGEHASSQGKANGAGSGGGAGASGTLAYIAALTASFALVSLAWAAPANNALPTAGQVVQGAASMSQAANQLTINQGTQRAAINWQSFNIGAASKVQVVQPNAQAVLLNRVVGQSPSQIFGQLNANGHVILVNPNGVLFGKDGSVNAGGFTASTLNISDANFMAGNMVYERNGSTAGIVNQGNITTAPGGYVALLGATVSNEGSIHTQGGSVVMGAGETIKVPVSGTGRIKLELTPAAINASVSNSGSIVTEGGQVYMQALALNRAAAQILQSGSIDTTGEQGGAVHLLADGGRIVVDGSITANSTAVGHKGGDIIIGRDADTGVLANTTDVRSATLQSTNGFVETSAKYLDFGGVNVQAGNWLLDPYNITIGATEASSIQSTLNGASGANVTVSTTTGGYNSNVSGDGNITINNAISKTTGGNSTLNFYADNGITFAGGIKITGSSTTGALDVNLTAKGTASGTSSYGIKVSSNSGVDTNGKLVIDSTSKYTGAWGSNGHEFSALAMLSGGVMRGSDVDITLNVNPATQNRVYGLFAQNNTTIEAKAGNLKIASTLKNASGTTGSMQFGSSTGPAMIVKASGNVTLTSDTTHSSNQAGVWGINLTDTKLSAGGNVSIDSQLGDAAANAIASGISSQGTSIVAAGKVALTSNKGRMSLGGLTSPATGTAGLQGTDITINNGTGSTGAGIEGVWISGGGNVKATTGAIDITGKSAGGVGVNVTNTMTAAGLVKVTGISSAAFTGANTSAITAGSVDVTGTSASTAGATTGVITATGDVTVTGTSGGASAGANTGAITTTNGLVKVTGTSNSGAGVIVNAITGKDITIVGNSTTGSVLGNSSVLNATAGNISITGVGNSAGGYAITTGNTITATGDILISTTSAAKHGMNLNGAIKSTAGAVTINSDIRTAGSGSAMNGSATVTAFKDVNITGKANGYYSINGLGAIESQDGKVTIDAWSGGSRALQLTNTVKAKGDVVLNGTGGNDNAVTTSTTATVTSTNGNVSITGISTGAGVGVNIGAAVTSTIGNVKVEGTSAGNKGVELANMLNATAGTVTLTGVGGGSSTGININTGISGIDAVSYKVLGTSTSGVGVNMNGTWTNTAKFKSTSTTVDSFIEGKTTSGGAGVVVGDGTLEINSAATTGSTGGKVFVRNTTDSKAGVNLYQRAFINTKGDVSFGRNDTDTSALWIQAITATANGGKLSFLGKSSSTYGIGFQNMGAAIVSITGNSGAAIVLDGTSTAIGGSHGINTQVGALANHTITSNGADGSITIKGTSETGTGAQLNLTAVTSNNGNAIDITGNGGGANKGIYMAKAITANDGGNINITGTASGSGNAVELNGNGGAGVITADTGKVTITGNAPGTAGTGAGISSTGNISGGTVEMLGTSAGTGAGISTSGLITATSATPGTGSGVVKTGDVKLEGTSAGGLGVVMNSNSATPAISATNEVNIKGTSTASANSQHGVLLNGSTTVQGQTVTVTGESVNGNAVIAYAAIKATTGDVKITGTSKGASTANTASALSLQGVITADQNIQIVGANTNASNTTNVVYLNKAVTATKGKIDVTASTNGTTANALTLASGAKLTGATEVNVKADTLSIDTSTNTAINASTVTIKTDSTDAKINIGAGDAGKTSLTSATLGLTNVELNRITAGNLVIGDTSNTGGITVSAATTTNATTGNVTMQTGGNIAVNAALTVVDAAATKNLTLNGAGTTSAISQTAAIKAAGLELLGANATHTLTNTGNVIKKLAGDTGTVSLTNNANFAIDTVNTLGLKTSGNTTLNSTATVTQTQAVNVAGLELLGTNGSYTLNNTNNTIQKLAGNTGSVSLTNKGDLEVSTVNTTGLTASGDVSIKTTAGSTTGNLGNLTLKKNITAANVDLNTAGSVFRDSTAAATDGIIKASLLRIKAGAGVGISTSRIKTDVATLSMESVGDQYVTEANAVTVAASSTTGSVNIDVTTDALTVGSSTLIGGSPIDGVSAATGVVLTTQAGDLNINRKISNSASGDVVLGAGVSMNAGVGTGGDVKTTSNMDVTNTNGNTYVYTGSASGAGLLSDLDTSFSELRLSGDMGTTPLAQNADSHVKYVAGQTIFGGAKAQVMFREKITLDTSSISGVALDKTYGDANTTSSAVDQAALFVQMQDKLKQANFGEIITRAAGSTNGANVFKISKAALINDLSGSLSAPTYSTSGHLTAKTHDYGELTSGKYTATLAAEKAQVKVAQLALTGSITPGASIYGDNLVAGSVSFTNTVGNDVVSAAGVTIDITGRASGSGHLNAGLYTDIQAVTGLKLTDADSGNYSFANVKGDYKVDQRQLTINKGAVADKTADGTTTATVTPSTLNNLVGTETLGVAATGVFSDASAGNGKAVRAFYTLQNGANGGLASNYILAVGTPTNPDTRMTGNILASVNPVINPTPSPVNNNTGSRVSTVSGFSGSGAATGVLDDKPVTESREVCSDVFPENCECQPSVVPSIEICFAPKRVAVTKEEK